MSWLPLPGFVTRNFRLKLIATVLASVTWAGVVYAANPPGERTEFVSVPQDTTTLPAGYVLVQHIPDLPVRIAGTQDHLNAFDRSSVVLKVHYEQIKGPGTVDIPVDIRLNDPNVELDHPPATVQVSVDVRDTASVPVKVVINPGPPPGYTSATVQTTPARVTVTGPRHELPGLEPRVAVDLSNQKANFEADLPVFLYDSNGNKLDDVNSSSPTVRVLITIVGVSTERVSAVVPPIRGSVASGYQMSAVTVSSPTVVLTGPQDILNGLDTVATDPINVGGLTGDRTFTVLVRTPQGVSPSPTQVTVHISVSPLPTPTPTPAPPGQVSP